MVRLLTDSGVLFQHIPRTGGTWFEHILSELKIPNQENKSWMNFVGRDHISVRHCLLSHYKRTTLAEVKYTMTFVRNPLDYYVSAWSWLSHATNKRRVKTRIKSGRWTWHPFDDAAACFDPSFNKWVEKMLRYHPLWYTRLIEWYVGPRGVSLLISLDEHATWWMMSFMHCQDLVMRM